MCVCAAQVVQAINYQSGLAADGHRFVLMLNLFFNQQLGIIVNNEIDAGNFTTDSFNLPLLPNTFLYSFNRATIPRQRGSCCVLGFHTYFTDGAVPETAGSRSSQAGFPLEFSAADLKT